MKDQCKELAIQRSDGIDVMNDEKWQETDAYIVYRDVKKLIRDYEHEVRPLDVDKYGSLIDEINKILWI